MGLFQYPVKNKQTNKQKPNIIYKITYHQWLNRNHYKEKYLGFSGSTFNLSGVPDIIIDVHPLAFSNTLMA